MPKKRYDLRYLPSAERDLLSIIDWIALDSPSKARSFLAVLDQRIGALASHPFLGRFPRTLSHYKIVEKLGRGGMGDVYATQDRKLGRIVALKVLPREMASSVERRERFQREAKALATLDHGIISNILERWR